MDDDSNIIVFPPMGPRDQDAPPIPALTPYRDPARVVARQLYLGLRSRAPSASRTQEMVLEALTYKRHLLPAEAPPADAELLKVWSAEDDWEGRYRQSLSVEIIDSPGTDGRRFLADLQYQCERAREYLLATTRELEGPPPVDHDDGKPWPSPGLIGRWQNAQRVWIDLSTRVKEARESVQRTDGEGTRDDYWEDQYQQTLTDLLDEYGDIGPQYRLMARRAASLDVRLRQMERSGRDIDPAEYKSIHETHLKYVAQMQKHREALKSESIQPVQDAVKKIVAILEKRIKNTDPSLWAAIVEDIVQATQEMGAA